MNPRIHPACSPEPTHVQEIGSDEAWALGAPHWTLSDSLPSAHSEHVTRVLLHGSSTVCTAGRDSKVNVWALDKAAGSLLHCTTLVGHTSRVEALASVPGTDLLISAGRDAQAFLWSVSRTDTSATQTTKLARAYLYEPVTCAASTSTPHVVLLGTASGLIMHVEASATAGGSLKVLAKTPVTTEGEVVSLACEGDTVVAGLSNGAVYVFKAQSGFTTKLVAAHDGPMDVCEGPVLSVQLTSVSGLTSFILSIAHHKCPSV